MRPQAYEEKGIKKASLAVGRKLSVIMYRMLIEEKEFRMEKTHKKQDKKC